MTTNDWILIFLMSIVLLSAVTNYFLEVKIRKIQKQIQERSENSYTYIFPESPSDSFVIMGTAGGMYTEQTPKIVIKSGGHKHDKKK